ncbi:hypothetical protein EYF80_043855 [Liparis tanakae]|uniref:Uncharacterized protein n=1 Tax=Liparis tanakae TaxID=230148 RepID=A0A4Z2FZJ2_9TELE|nr:hypothetical protein EYF80_043855 [Liparis tanakae]
MDFIYYREIKDVDQELRLVLSRLAVAGSRSRVVPKPTDDVARWFVDDRHEVAEPEENGTRMK